MCVCASLSSSRLWVCVFVFRSCWVCFATDEDDRTAEWVRPCRCRGSTKWVHQACLQRWVDEKQRGNSTARVACPQCNAEYLIVFPKLGGWLLTKDKSRAGEMTWRLRNSKTSMKRNSVSLMFYFRAKMLHY